MCIFSNLLIYSLKENSTSFLYNEDFLRHIKTPDYISGVMSTYGKISRVLLSSRLYCRSWNSTRSAAEAGRGL